MTTLRGLLERRRSTKAYRDDRIDSAAVRDLVATVVGRSADGRRGHGSAHARYAVQISLITHAVDSLASAAYRYDHAHDELVTLADGDFMAELARGTLDADWLEHCPAALVLSADTATADKVFADQGPHRGTRFCWIETGLIAQNVYLWAAENGIGTVLIGGLDDQAIAAAAAPWLGTAQMVTAVMPIGIPQG
ncbi:SagB/ThcOx family dehydrogenase [Gordonia sp. HY442]|uniref:SagB/ThcOx family dehydrogenase n=1 Tax=Gordonia zhenghanii TaxID=2911516 RepID=UPI001F2F1854|nr:SagB/ThcOx family dehydrogenase [Gordonia zhenghanii]MCF8604852.1 SagB/ThcOx family dehydrogenase [Gordonia zhenghanii]